ncbi:MAG: alginate export family protein [Candidatus Kapaibacteriales bacterium]
MQFNYKLVRIPLLFIIVSLKVSASDFGFTGEYIARSEFRNGYNQPIADSSDPGGFIAHRARVEGFFETGPVKMFASLQDIRTWGAVPTTKTNDEFLSIYEAYLEATLFEGFSIKIGRQELNYDNARFLGNLDWALQGRSHDFALAKYEINEVNHLHGGFGFNQERQSLTAIPYSASQYQNAQFLRYEYNGEKLKLATMIWNNGVDKLNLDSSNANVSNYTTTIGLPWIKYDFGFIDLSGSYYHQLGENEFSKSVSAYQAMGQVGIDYEVVGNKARSVVGAEVLSGNTIGEDDITAFTPYYGTNHAHNGHIDYFYVNGRWMNSSGLIDIYYKGRVSITEELFLQADFHYFNSHKPFVLDEADDSGFGSESRYLGSEVDFVASYSFSKELSFQGGYSRFFGSDNFLNLYSAHSPQQWAYFMIIFRPNGKSSTIGIPI